mmetsp:Transcript_23809/g.41674  ORF Transcript_23809/g.41674 Transcript_23809/m.41674 type:complete len:284 (-) Transcript_23809:574-1425(-)
MRRSPPAAADVADAEGCGAPGPPIVALCKRERPPAVVDVVGRIVFEEESKITIWCFSFHNELLKRVTLLRYILGKLVYNSALPSVCWRLNNHSTDILWGTIEAAAGRLWCAFGPFDPQWHSINISIVERVLGTLRIVARVHKDVATGGLILVFAMHDVHSGHDSVTAEQLAKCILTDASGQLPEIEQCVTIASTSRGGLLLPEVGVCIGVMSRWSTGCHAHVHALAHVHAHAHAHVHALAHAAHVHTHVHIHARGWLHVHSHACAEAHAAHAEAHAEVTSCIG